MSDFDKFEKSLLKLQDDLKGGAGRAFLKAEGKKLQKKTLAVAQQKTKKKTGNYLKGIKNGKVYNFDGAFACRVYSTAPHAHLIEYGHKIVDRNKKNIGYQRGLYVFENAKKQFKNEFEEDTTAFIDDLWKKNGL